MNLFIGIKYIFTAISGIVISDDDIVLHIVPVNLYDVNIIPELYFNFTTFMRDDMPILNTIHELYLDFVDFALVCFVFNLAYKKWKEMTDK